MDLNVELDLLSIDEVEKERLENSKEKLISSTLTDLALIFGTTSVSTDKGDIGCFWTKSQGGPGKVLLSDSYFQRDNCDPYRRYPAIKPVIRNKDLYDNLYDDRIVNSEGIEEVEFGEYPQFTVAQEVYDKLEALYKAHSLEKTGATYTFDSLFENYKNLPDYEVGFKPVRYNEYEYEDKKYIRVRRTSMLFDRKLSNGMRKFDKDYFWIEVTPIKWIIDTETKTLVSKHSLVSGLCFGPETTYEESFIKKYFDGYMLHDIVQHYYPELLKQQKIDIEKMECKNLKNMLLKIFKNKNQLENKICPDGTKVVNGRFR